MSYGVLIPPKEARGIASVRCISESKSELLGKLSGFDVCRVAEKLASRFPVSKTTDPVQETHFWFTNEYPGNFDRRKVSLAKTIASISKLHPESTRKVSIVTGESGLLSCIPELSHISKLIIQVDHDPVLLLFIKELLKNLSSSTSINKDQYNELIKLSLGPLKKSGSITDEDESNILKFAEKYRNLMGELHCFSSQERLEEFKIALSQCHVQAVQASYFSKEDMDCLFKILNEEGLEVSFFNISNVAEYCLNFYLMNPFNGVVKDMESTTFIRAIPLSQDALCAYSSLLSLYHHTDTCTKRELFDRLYQINKAQVLSDLAMYVGKPQSEISDLSTACVELAKIDRRATVIATCHLRLLLAHITKDESLALSHRVARIDQSLAKNRAYDTEARREFMEIIRAAL